MPLGPTPLTPGQPEGVRQIVRLKIAAAVRALTDALGAMGEVSSDEGRAVLRALQTLAPVTPDVDEGVSQSELAAMIARATAPPLPAPGLLGMPGPTPRPVASAAQFPPRPIGPMIAGPGGPYAP
jgi:hypothetical protein